MNRVNRVSVALSVRGVKSIVEGVDEAFRLGYRLNRWITINWEQGGVSSNFHKAQTHFWKRACEWLRRRNVPFAQVWVLEDHRKTGIHGHYLVHVPPLLAEEFGRMQRGWLRKAGCRTKRGIMKSEQLPKGAEIGRVNGLARYILKSADKGTCAALEIDRKPGGTISGKRCGVSEFLGQAARSRSKAAFKVNTNHLRARMSVALGHIDESDAEKWLLTRAQRNSLSKWRLDNLAPPKVLHRT